MQHHPTKVLCNHQLQQNHNEIICENSPYGNLPGYPSCAENGKPGNLSSKSLSKDSYQPRDQTCANSLETTVLQHQISPENYTEPKDPKTDSGWLLPASHSQAPSNMSVAVFLAPGQDKTAKQKSQTPPLPTTAACKPGPTTTKKPQYKSMC